MLTVTAFVLVKCREDRIAEVHGRQSGKRRSWHFALCDMFVAKLTYDLTRPPR